MLVSRTLAFYLLQALFWIPYCEHFLILQMTMDGNDVKYMNREECKLWPQYNSDWIL